MRLIFWTPFNRAMFPQIHRNKKDIHPSLTESWILPRFRIWDKLTWHSIQNQSFSDWRYVVCCHEKSRDITDGLFSTIKDKRLIVCYTNEEKKWVNEIGRGQDRIVSVRVDSDDMYHPQAAAEVLSYAEFGHQYVSFRYGYAMEYATGRMFNYDCGGTGPFFGHIRGNRDWGRCRGINDINHVQIAKYHPLIVPQRRFIVGLTRMNTSTSMGIKNVGRELIGENAAYARQMFNLRCKNANWFCRSFRNKVN